HDPSAVRRREAEPYPECVPPAACLEDNRREVDRARAGALVRHRRPVVHVVGLAMVAAGHDGADERLGPAAPRRERLHRLVRGMLGEERDHVPLLAAKDDLEGLKDLGGHAYGATTTACPPPRPRRRRPPRRRRRRFPGVGGLAVSAAAEAASGSPALRSAVSASSVPCAAGSSAGPGSTSRTAPVRPTSSSLMRRSRVISRGEPGVRRKPRALRAFERASMLTVRSGARASSSRATARSSSWGAVWPSPAGSLPFATGVAAVAGGDGAASSRRPRRPPRRRRRERGSLALACSGSGSAAAPATAR